MAIPKAVRDQLLVEARHRCTICSEKCFEIHHIIELAEGGTDEIANLIVLCPNCHQHRCHRSAEFTRDQLILYKHRLREQNEVAKRVLQNLEEIRQMLPTSAPEELETKLKEELQEAAMVISPDRSPGIYATVQQTSEWLAERDLIRGGARRAIEIEWEVIKEREKRKYPEVKIQRVD
ncbi:HNH endonuclease, partial [Candidatus Sumerlaeota bacterium]|nr:HNH endonuclease [Candidatus Sumerlaeota bacterium]